MFHMIGILNSSRYIQQLYHILKESEGDDSLDNGKYRSDCLELDECLKELEETWEERLEQIKELGDVGETIGHGDV